MRVTCAQLCWALLAAWWPFVWFVSCIGATSVNAASALAVGTAGVLISGGVGHRMWQAFYAAAVAVVASGVGHISMFGDVYWSRGMTILAVIATLVHVTAFSLLLSAARVLRSETARRESIV